MFSVTGNLSDVGTVTPIYKNTGKTNKLNYLSGGPFECPSKSLDLILFDFELCMRCDKRKLTLGWSQNNE